MNTKNGISLVVLVITIIVTVIITTLTILQIDNVMYEVNKDDFVVEITTIEDKIKEHYLLTGSLPINENIQYTMDELKSELGVDNQVFLSNEIMANEDVGNVFYEVDLNKLDLETTERGLKREDTDIYVVATNSLNVYYVKGYDIEGTIYFSTVLLVDSNEVEKEDEVVYDTVILTDDLNVVKSTDVWTNEIVITVKSNVSSLEKLQYSIAGVSAKEFNNKKITINKDSMSLSEKTAFVNDKVVTINKLKDGVVVASEEVSIANLDVEQPVLGSLESVSSTETGYNVLNIVRSDTGGSGIKAIYYDYDEILKDNNIEKYYTDRTTVTADDLLTFGKITTTGSIKLEKNVKSIVAVAVDNSGNVSNVVTYTIEDMYLESK